MNPICDILKTLRQAKGLTQDQLGKALGMSAQAISNYENGSREPGLDGLARFANFFDVSADYMLGRSQYADRIEYAGNVLGLSKEAAYNLLRNASSITDVFIGNENLTRLVQAIDSYYLSDISPPARVRIDVFFEGDPNNPDDSRKRKAYQALLKHGFAEIALSEIKDIAATIVKQMKEENDRKRAEARKGLSSKDLLLNAVNTEKDGDDEAVLSRYFGCIPQGERSSSYADENQKHEIQD